MASSVNQHILNALRPIVEKVQYEGSGIYVMEITTPPQINHKSPRIKAANLQAHIGQLIHGALTHLPIHWELYQVQGTIHDKTLTVTIICS